MKLITKTVFTSALFASLPVTQAAPGDLFELSANVALTSDYVWRGMTQTNEEPAIQGGFDVNHDSGLYVGTWGSNVKFLEGAAVNPEDRAHIEIDLYIGYAGELRNGITYDVKAGHYIYPGADSSLEYDMTEFNLTLGYSLPQGTELSAVYDYSPEFAGAVGSAHHYMLGATHGWDNGLSLGAHLGRQQISDNANFGFDDYTYYGASVSFPISSFEGSVAYSNTDLDNADDVADARVFFTLSKDF